MILVWGSPQWYAASLAGCGRGRQTGLGKPVIVHTAVYRLVPELLSRTGGRLRSPAVVSRTLSGERKTPSKIVRHNAIERLVLPGLGKEF